MHVSRTIRLYAVNLLSDVCQLFLIKLDWGKYLKGLSSNFFLFFSFFPESMVFSEGFRKATRCLDAAIVIRQKHPLCMLKINSFF